MIPLGFLNNSTFSSLEHLELEFYCTVINFIQNKIVNYMGDGASNSWQGSSSVFWQKIHYNK